MCRTIRLRLQNRIEGRDGSSCGRRYFSVEILSYKLILRHHLLKIPSTGIKIKNFKTNHQYELNEFKITRLSNNPVENYFGVINNRILVTLNNHLFISLSTDAQR
ncbi:hypothetical protein BpHYR1_049880 [Brachionus plicatilis]|uniref:Uncharacterized protein n=1 Tax=Brachionus plicatilis TaxID=10195 RepID=A0A3M7TB57_BRAPC|nr:hypothetical protein BpHYR1_049880 [Brachionus plicatilis]